MNEQEVIDFLKNNKTKGIAFAFLPAEVRQWCCDHSSSLIYFQSNNVWNDNSASDVLFKANEIVALPEDFKLTKLKKSAEVNQGWWEEFEIDDCQEFLVELVDTVTGKECHFCFNWFDWIGCLNKCKDQGIMLTNFGGWQYNNGDGWYMDPQVYDRLEHYCFDEYLDCNSVRPATPKKIRFWRER